MSAISPERNRRGSRRRRALMTLVGATVVWAVASPAASANPAVGVFSNPGTIAIPGTGTSGPANPYPSTIHVSRLYPHITDVNATFSSLSHTFPDDIDALLANQACPGSVGCGRRTLLMSDAGDADTISNVSLVFDDESSNFLPNDSQISSGTYHPTNYGGGDTFPPPAPPGPYSASLATFDASSTADSNPNGRWRLFINDDDFFDTGHLVGWRLRITASPNPGACTNTFVLTNGNDTFGGGRGGDRVFGRAGNDLILGRRGRDCLSGGSGRDRLSGGSGRDRISGGSGRDRILGGKGGDRISGRRGGDRISGGGGRDRIRGNSGNDRIRVSDGRRDRVNCGTGFDRVRADSIDIIASNCEVVVH